MNDLLHMQLVKETVAASATTMEKAASGSPEQVEIIQAAFPSSDEGLTKLATLARVLATGLVINEAEQSLSQTGV